MLPVSNDRVRELFFTGNFGLEKEGLRVTPDGFFAQTPHPFPGDKHIVRDFSENQTEINTPVFSSAEETIASLTDYTAYIHKTLAGLDPPELYWPLSNPPYIRREPDIPIAQFYGDEAYKTAYREHLTDVYGRYKMTVSGIHVNYSFSDELLKEAYLAQAPGWNDRDFRLFKDKLYLSLAAHLCRYGWLVTAVTAASPILDSSFIEKGILGNDVFLGFASLRCSELGYWNLFVPAFDYTNIEKYCESIRNYVDNGLIASASELYYPIRIKPRGTNTLEHLMERGADHIELRNVDVNPFCFAGLDLRDLKFIQYFILYLASCPPLEFPANHQILAAQNFKHAARYDLQSVNILQPGGQAKSVVDTALEVLERMEEFYKVFPADSDRDAVLQFEKEKFVNPDTRYAWQIRKHFCANYVQNGLELAEQRRQEAMEL